MKTWLLGLLMVLISVSDLFAVGSPITPPSSGKSGLVKSNRDAAYKQTGDIYITGNVTQGKQFQGVIPYGAPSDFAAPLGSTSLDNFIKSSSSMQNYQSSRTLPGIALPYYSPTRTTTKFQNGTILGQRATTDYSVKGYVSTPLMRPPSESARLSKELTETYSTTLSQIKTRPLTRTGQELYDSFRKDFYHIAAEKERIRKLEGEKKEIAPEEIEKKEVRQPSEIERLIPKPSKTELTEYEKTLEDKYERKFEEADIFDVIKERLKELDEQKAQEKIKKDQTKKPEAEEEAQKKPEDLITSALEIKKPQFMEAESTQAQTIRGKHKTFASYASNKYNNYMQLAEDYMHKGKYYKAADAYSLAAIFRDKDPLPYAGQSLALFAAGEYMSSSFYLQKAILTFPRFPEIEIDISALVGDKDIIETRIVDVKKWKELNNSSELALLLSYVYCQIDNPQWAKEQLDDAKLIMGQTPAITAMENAIEKKMKKK